MGSAFVFLTPATFAEVLPAPGCRLQPALAPQKMAKGRGIRGEGGSGGRSGLGAVTPPAPPPGLWARPRRRPPPHGRCARRRGAPGPRLGPRALRAPTHLRRRRRSAARGAGRLLPPARGGGSGRRGGGCRGGAHHLGRVAGSSGAAARTCEPLGRPGAASRAPRPARPPLPLRSCLRLPPGLRRSLPAGRVSGPSAEDPPPGAALRLLRRLRRRRLLPASRPPGRPRGARGLGPARESRRARGRRRAGRSPGAPTPAGTHAPQGERRGPGSGRRGRRVDGRLAGDCKDQQQQSQPSFIELLLSAKQTADGINAFVQRL